MAEEEQDNLIIIEEKLTQAFSKLHYEIDFAAKALDIKSSNFGNSLHDSISALKLSLSELENLTKQAKDQNSAMLNGLATFTLLPEKITNSMMDIAPQIASEVEKIHSASVLEVKDQFTALHSQFTESIRDYKVKLEDLANQSLSSLDSATEKFNTAIEQKLTQFTNQLTTDAELVSKQKSLSFFKKIAAVVLFSALVSGVTSYLVATQFPRYVEVKGARDLTINNSKVEVWGAKLIDKKEAQGNTLK